MENNMDKIRQQLKRKQDPPRYEHTLGVAYTAMALAMCHGCDIKKAELAGLLHDCAKCMSDDQKLSKCVKYNISITEVERRIPSLLHAKLGAFLAMDKYHVEDKDIIHAILYHTTGRPAMSMLEKIIYIADYIEPNRTKASNLEETRRCAFRDLDQTMYIILRDTLIYLQSRPGEIDSMTVKAYEYYHHLQEEKEKISQLKEHSQNVG